MCDAGIEDCDVCALDCGTCCGNGLCDRRENFLSCPIDCCELTAPLVGALTSTQVLLVLPGCRSVDHLEIEMAGGTKKRQAYLTIYSGVPLAEYTVGIEPQGTYLFRQRGSSANQTGPWSQALLITAPSDISLPLTETLTTVNSIVISEEAVFIGSGTFWIVIGMSILILLLVILIVVTVIRQKQGKQGSYDLLVRRTVVQPVQRMSQAIRTSLMRTPGGGGDIAMASLALNRGGFTEGQTVSAQFTEDNTWYNATVQQWDEASEHWLVLYTEYGNQEWLPLPRIRKL